MARRRRSTLALSAEHARHALAVLVHEGKLKASEVRKALQRRERLIRALRDSLAALGEDVGQLRKRYGKDGFSPRLTRTARAAKPRVIRRKPRMSPATRKKFQAQGRYMAALRFLSKESRARVKAIRAESGVRTAIAAAKSRLAQQRFITRQRGSPGKNQKQIGERQSKDSDQRWKKNNKRRRYPARPNSKPDKHGGSGAGRQQGGSGVGREHG